MKKYPQKGVLAESVKTRDKPNIFINKNIATPIANASLLALANKKLTKLQPFINTYNIDRLEAVLK